MSVRYDSYEDRVVGMAPFLILFLLFQLAIVSATGYKPSFTKKTLQVTNCTQYAYIYEKAQDSKPTFLLLHGFPSSSQGWHKQIEDLSKAGYGVLAPDLLGYGDTDKPIALEEYANSKMSAHVARILDHEGLTEVIGVGHDW